MSSNPKAMLRRKKEEGRGKRGKRRGKKEEGRRKREENEVC